MKGIEIERAFVGSAAEKLAAPFGFKGRAVDSLRQSAVLLEGGGVYGCGCGVQSVVWSDPAAFEIPGTDSGNSLMLALTERAARLLEGCAFSDPTEAIAALRGPLLEYGRKITGLPELRSTFVLNALVPVDLALWQLYFRAGKFADFDAMIPGQYAPALAGRQREIAGFPLITYGLDGRGITALADGGAFFFKIKIGSDPEKDGDREKMLAWDAGRVAFIDSLLKERRTPYTDCGRPLYYLDANGRYDSRDRLMRLLDAIDRVGALERVALVEEPFAEGSGIPVDGIPVVVAADESAHGVTEAAELMEMGYKAMALKPIAKTLSVSLGVAALAEKKGVACFCADLTVPPVMVEWNKSVAARLERLPGLKTAVFETNGAQNYPDWARLESYLPHPEKPWHRAKDGIFTLDGDFYSGSADLFCDSEYYINLAKNGIIGKEVN